MTHAGRSIELFFHDGNPEGMTTATIPFQWTGHVLVTNRTQVFEALNEPETELPGIYLLVGENEGVPTLYVGETDEIRSRIEQHIREGKKEWWERAVFVTAQGEPLNKAHARYLESRVYELAKQISKVELDNKQAPTESQLSKAATAHMEDFLSNLRLVLPALRFDFLTAQSKPKTEVKEDVPQDNTPYFILNTKEVSARAHQDGGAFVVEEGSDARSEWVGSTTAQSGYSRLYNDLVAQGIIGDLGEKRVFLQSYGFSSTSAAAAVVTGRPASGPATWFLEEDPSQSFSDYEKARAKENSDKDKDQE